MSRDEEEKAASAAAASDDSDDSSCSSEEDDDLILEGVLVRNPDASDSSSDEDSDADEDDTAKPPAAKKQKPNVKGKPETKANSTQSKKKKKKKKAKDGPEIVDMEFTFCEMDEKFFHGIKALLSSSSPAYLTHSSALSDLMIENASVGTVISTEYQYKPGQERDPEYEGVVYGFASILNVTTHKDNEAIKALTKLCLSKCPEDRKAELKTVLSGTTKRPAGFYFQSRMVNLPLEIVEVLHQQLILDMDWAVENASNEAQRKSLDFGVFLRIAPTYREKGSGGGGASYYKYFDDELLANHAEFTYEIELPKTFGMEETPYCSVIVLTKKGHRDAIKNLKQLVNVQ
jgi:protein BCP1